ncbi:MAG: DUF2905 domain-containing protein [Flavobacteriales bacterium]|nr:DUF2905 domain-containing protein [Flavobacteriales bacterium]MCB9193813.1 DUF2905 domain-containing protein [Flavobacteriales bacterium]
MSMRRPLVLIGVCCLVPAARWPWLRSGRWWRWTGHLPGDIHMEIDGFSFHFPLTTCIVVSVLIRAIVLILRR